VRGRIVAVLEKRGRFLVGIPFFPRHAGDRNRAIAVDRSRDARPGRLVVLGGGSGRAKIERVLGRPDVARDVIEALMIDRGLMRRFPAGVERAAKEAIETV
jgi:ribonuclease R